MKRRLRQVISGLCFLGLVPMGTLVALRLLHAEHTRTVISLETFTFYLLLPAYVILVFALLTSQKIMIGLATLIVVCHAAWMFPEFDGQRPLPARATTAKHLTLYSQNVEYDGHSPAQIGTQIKAANADFVFLEELSVSDFDAMWAEGAFDGYKYSFVQTSYGPTGLGIFSKYPLSSSQEVPSPGFPQMRSVANVGGKDLVLWNVHIRSPLDGPVEQNWLADFAQLKDRIDSETGPTLVAGDFNATWGHRPFRNLLTHGYHEADTDLGRGYARTWPVDMPQAARVDGFIRLDHVLYNQHLQATHIREVPGGGSDHRGVVTNLDLF